MEKLDIIDKQGKLTNKTAPRNEVHQKGLLHHASGLIIFRRTNSSGGGIGRYYLNNGR